MKRFLFLLITIALFSACSSTKSTEKKVKVFNGKITYAITYDGDITPAQIAQAPKTMEISSMDQRLLRETISGQGSQIVIVNGEFKVMYTMFDFGQMGRFAIRTPFDSIPNDTSKAPKWEEDYMTTESTKLILGYTTKKVVVTETKEGEEDRIYNVFVCPELGDWPEIEMRPSDDKDKKGLEAVPMQFVEYAEGIKMTYTATHIKKGGVKAVDFSKPTDFKQVTLKELQAIFSGGGQ